MVVWSSGLGVSVEVSSLVDSACSGCVSVAGSRFHLCLDRNQGHSTVLHPTVDVGISNVSVLACQDVPAWYIVYLYGQKVQLYMPVVIELPHVYFVCFSMSLSLINQIGVEECFLNHENDLEDCGPLRALSIAWFVMPLMIQEI